jgi:hypothetical protein
MEDPLAKQLDLRHQELKSIKAENDGMFQLIKRLVRPDTSDFFGKNERGDRQSENIYDGTAPGALEIFASALSTFTVDPTSRFMNLEVEGF